MNEIWKQSSGAARKAIILGGWAQSLFLFSFVLTRLIPVWGREGVFFLFFWPVSLLLAVGAMVQSAGASRQGLWWRPDGGKIFVCVLFGLPILLLVFCPDADAAALRVSHQLSMETITSIFLFWVVHAILGAVLAMPVLFIGLRRASLARWELLALVIPYWVWVSLMFSPLSAGRKSFANLLAPFCISFAMPFLAWIRIVIRPKMTKGVYAASFITIWCAVGVAVFFLVPLLNDLNR